MYETVPGWETSLKGVQKFADLPPNAVKYINRISALIEVPAVIIWTSPEREDTILVKDMFFT